MNTLLEKPIELALSELDEIRHLEADAVMGTYARNPVLFVRGEGATLWDSEGKSYLDFLGGIAVISVGHCHPHVTATIAEQAGKLVHVSNLFYNEFQGKLAAKLCDLTGMERVFFCNSGAEASECALKLARKWGKQNKSEAAIEIVTFSGSFHGRTMGAVTATAQPKYQTPFAPLVPGFHYADRNDLAAAEKLIGANTCAVFLEPIQGESGIHPMTPEFMQGLRKLCDERNVLLIADEVQCGMGRTGDFLAIQGYGVLPDVVTMAKGLANGFPIGACLARGEAAHTLVPGDHGSTFAGQPLACAAAWATLEVLENENLMQNAAEVGACFKTELEALKAKYPNLISEVRGKGLMLGMDFATPQAKSAQTELRDAGIIVNATSENTLRFLPPLNVTKEDCRRVVQEIECFLQNNPA